MYKKTIICLANSRKPPSGRCVAGKEYENNAIGNWLRPVSKRDGHAVSEEERRYDNGPIAQLLDIISIPLRKPDPYGHQSENHVLDDGYYWQKKRLADWSLVQSCIDKYDRNFWGYSESTYYGENDKVSEANLSRFQHSLTLIQVTDLQILVKAEDGYQGAPSRRRVRGQFTLYHNTYILSITDPEIEDMYLKMDNGNYNIGGAVLCISLAEVWNGFAYRVIASVITQERCQKIHAH